MSVDFLSEESETSTVSKSRTQFYFVVFSGLEPKKHFKLPAMNQTNCSFHIFRM